jgi:hypothetical protein
VSPGVNRESGKLPDEAGAEQVKQAKERTRMRIRIHTVDRSAHDIEATPLQPIAQRLCLYFAVFLDAAQRLRCASAIRWRASGLSGLFFLATAFLVALSA